jgi:dUTP pyrophosphatase
MSQLLNIYGRYMVLKIFLDTNDNILKNKYIDAAHSHNNELVKSPNMIDAGFDLFTPDFYTASTPLNKIDFKLMCSATMVLDSGKIYNTGYYMYPRSSLSKTKLRLANATGIIDAGYRGNLIGMFDCNGGPDDDYTSELFSRLLQICAPSLMPIFVDIVENIEELGPVTSRGGGGIGSTGI